MPLQPQYTRGVDIDVKETSFLRTVFQKQELSTGGSRFYLFSNVNWPSVMISLIKRGGF